MTEDRKVITITFSNSLLQLFRAMAASLSTFEQQLHAPDPSTVPLVVVMCDA